MAGAAVTSANAAEIAVPAADAKHGASAAASAASAPTEKTKPASASASASEHGSAEASAAASASAASEASVASVPPVPTKMVRVLPKLKYKKEKPVEKPTNYPALIAAGVGVLLLAGAGAIYWRRKKAGAGPLKIWQGFRKKKPAEPVPEEAQPLHEVTPESLMQ
jgi:pilus assembly protein FimV